MTTAATNGVPNPRFSVVIPVYRSAAMLPELVRRLDGAFDALGGTREVLFVVDGCPEGSAEILRGLGRGRADLRVLDLDRNYGQNAAILCGLRHARGEMAILLDSDLQNPPEEVVHLVRKADEGHDLVFGAFRVKQHAPIRRFGSRVVVAWLATRLFRKPPGLVMSNVRLLRREVIDAVAATRAGYPYITGLSLLAARSPASVPVEHAPRAQGRSTYGLLDLAAIVGRIVFHFAPPGLRVALGIAAAAAAGGIAAAIALAAGADLRAFPWLPAGLALLGAGAVAGLAPEFLRLARGGRDPAPFYALRGES